MDPDSGIAPEEEAAPEPVALETAASWLAAARPASVLALLREPDFAHLSMTAFAGFRVNAGGYGNPLVRRRLAQEITRNDTFAQKMRALAEQSPPAPEPAPAPPPPERTAGTSTRREEELKAERDRRRRERDEAREAVRRAEEQTARSRTALAAAQGAQAEQSRLAQQQAQRIERLERQVARLQAEQTHLLKALRQDKVSSPPRAPAPTPKQQADADTGTAWREAVTHLLHKGRQDTALGLALDVLRANAEDLVALDIAARAYQQKGQPREAAEMVRRILSLRLARAEVGPASDALVRLLLLLPDPADAARDVRQWLPSLKTDGAIAAGRAAVGRLRGQSPAAHAWLEAEVRAARPALADALMPPPGALGPDDPLPLPLAGEWSARRLTDAVNANAEAAVADAREALGRLDAETAARVWDALDRAVKDGDDTALAPLRRAPRGPAVVDGSNAAWFDQHSYAAPRPRLRPLLELRRALRRRGYFPVLLYADAPLPHTVDDPQTLRALLGRGEIALVDSGVDADEVLLREAKRYGAPLVTNDYMADWDPHNQVEKIQFTISLTGEAHLLS